MNKNRGSVVRKIKNYTYLLDDLLGEGSTGQVYMGLDQKTRSKVAIKVIDMKQIDNEVTYYLLQCQKQALTSVSHPNVLHAYDIIQQPQNCYIITQLCPHGTLKEYIRQKKNLSEEEALSIFSKLVQGYLSIKEKHFVHRDLKSSNIMLKDGEPIIIDFGYCEKTYGTKPKIFYNVGSPSYMSPEAYYKTSYSQKSDIWGLGIILYEMLEGHTIDYGQDINKYFKGLIKNGFNLKQPVSERCLMILKMCLSINQDKRTNTEMLISKLTERQSNNINKISSPHQNHDKRYSIKDHKNRIMQIPNQANYVQQQHFMQQQLPNTDNFSLRSKNQQRVSTEENCHIPLTESIFRKPASTTHKQQSTNALLQGTQKMPGIPLTPNPYFTPRNNVTDRNNRIGINSLFNAESVVSSQSYQDVNRIKLNKNQRRPQQPILVQSFHSNAPNPNIRNSFNMNNEKFMAQSTQISNQPFYPPQISGTQKEQSIRNSVNIVVPHHQNRKTPVYYSTIISPPPQNLPQNIIHQQRAPSNHLHPQQHPNQAVSNPFRMHNSLLTPQQQQKNLFEPSFSEMPQRQTINIPESRQIQRNSHNQFMKNAHQAFMKKNVPFFENKPHVIPNHQMPDKLSRNQPFPEQGNMGSHPKPPRPDPFHPKVIYMNKLSENKPSSHPNGLNPVYQANLQQKPFNKPQHYHNNFYSNQQNISVNPQPQTFNQPQHNIPPNHLNSPSFRQSQPAFIPEQRSSFFITKES